jgi:hypothetical protein
MSQASFAAPLPGHFLGHEFPTTRLDPRALALRQGGDDLV